MSPIGVFDSGVGGLTVVRELRKRLPREDIIYLGDTARVPYGTKSPQTVERYALNCLDFLLRHNASMVLVACNTASANALPSLVAATDVPVIGAVEPGAMAAESTSQTGHVAVVGTLGTIRSGAYEAAIRLRRPDARVLSLTCPLFVPLAEEGWGDTDIAQLTAERYLEPLRESENSLVDTMVLGCTHYPLLTNTIARACVALGRDIRLVDSASTMAAQAEEQVGALSLAEEGQSCGTGRLHICVTDATRMDELAPRFLGENPHSVELVDLS